MARISTYTIDSSIDGTEFLLGREADGTTKQFSMSALQTYLATAISPTTVFATIDVNGGAVDGTPIGASSASTGAFTNITASGTAGITGNTTVGGTLGVTGVTTMVDVNVTGELNFDGSAGTAGYYLQSSGDGVTPVWDQLSLNDISDVKVVDNSLYIGHDPSGNAGFSSTQYNIAVGATALDAITTGDQNIAIGHNALGAVTTVSSAVAIGYEAGKALVSTASTGGSVFIGSTAGTAVTTGCCNVAIGSAALTANTTGEYNTAVGYYSLTALSTDGGNIPNNNTAFGAHSGEAATYGDKGTYIGSAAGKAVTTASNNTFVGALAGTATTTGANNTAIGTEAMDTNVLGSDSAALGYQALFTSNVADARNVAVGSLAGKLTNTGTQNVFAGYAAGTANTTGSNNVALGSGALIANTIGASNISIGKGSLAANVDGSKSVAVGELSLEAQDPSGAADMHNVCVGYNSGADVTTGTQNTIVGSLGSDQLTTGAGNVALGYNTTIGTVAVNQIVIGAGGIGHGDNIAVIGSNDLTAIHPGDDNGVDLGSTSYSFKDAYIQSSLKIGDTSGSTYFQLPTAIGTANQVLQVPSSGNVLEWSSAAGGVSFYSGDGNLLVGHSTAPISSAVHNVGLGESALDSLTTGDGNTAIGSNSGTSLASGGFNTLLGYDSGSALTLGAQNVVLGYNALESAELSNQTVAIGYDALKSLTAQYPGSVAVGHEAGESINTGTLNTIVGYQAGKDGTSASKNTAIGYHALHAEGVGQESVAVGHNALVAQVASASSLAKNVAVGSQAGLSNTEGYHNVFLGMLAGNTNTTGDSNIVIGYNAEKSSATTDNEIVIGSSGAGLGANSTVIGNTSTVNAKVFGLRTPVTAITGNTSITANNSGETFVFNDADGAIISLPDSGGGDLTGVYFHFFIAAQVTSNAHKVVCADTTNEKLLGSIHSVDSDADASASIWNAQASDNFSAINITGVATGKPGSHFTITNMATDVWHIRGEVVQSGGSEATPFATS